MHGGLKTNQQLLQDVVAGVANLRGVVAVVCVPFPYLAQAQSVLAGTPVGWGAQNLSEQAQGAFTGEVSAAMLQDFGCRYALVGPVSYTHLDVYKRQPHRFGGLFGALVRVKRPFATCVVGTPSRAVRLAFMQTPI